MVVNRVCLLHTYVCTYTHVCVHTHTCAHTCVYMYISPIYLSIYLPKSPIYLSMYLPKSIEMRHHLVEGADIDAHAIVVNTLYQNVYYCQYFFGRKPSLPFRKSGRGENREESAGGALLRALHAPGGADEDRIARGCPASMCTAP